MSTGAYASAEAAEAIARLDAVLAASDAVAATATAAAPAPLSKRLGYVGAGVLSGWMFGGVFAGGPVGVPFCAALGAMAGVLRAVTGRSALEYLCDGAAAPQPHTQRLCGTGLASEAPRAAERQAFDVAPAVPGPRGPSGGGGGGGGGCTNPGG